MHYHGTMSTTVRKLEGSRVAVQSVILSTNYEAVATLLADARSFHVQDAAWQIHRSPQSRFNGKGEAPELVGVEAFFNAGPALKAVGEAHGDLPRQLMTECVKGIILSETYLYKERGYSTLKECDDTFVQTSLNTCYLHSNLDRQTVPWLDYIANRDWGDLLFDRTHTVTIHYGDGAARAEGLFIDSFHEIHISLETVSGIITKVESVLVRVPDPICRETQGLLSGFENKAVDTLTKQEVGRVCGGGLGCAHLSDLFSYMLKVMDKQI